MREYRFRGKRIDNGEWVYGYLFQSKYGTSILVNRDDRELDPGWFYPNDVFECHKVDPETVGQYTGLKDSVSDEEWYEGDIISSNPHSTRTEVEVICFDSHQGKYKSVPLSLYRSNAGNGGWTGYDIKCYQKRLGNRWDNLNLLEVK